MPDPAQAPNMTVIGCAAATLWIEMDGDDSSCESARDIGADHVADVHHSGGGDSGVGESGMKDRRVWFRGSDDLRVDDPGDDRSSSCRGLTDTSVMEILGCVTIGVGHQIGRAHV